MLTPLSAQGHILPKEPSGTSHPLSKPVNSTPVCCLATAANCCNSKPSCLSADNQHAKISRIHAERPSSP